MAFTLFGLYFLILAVLNALGKKVFLEKNYRNSDRGKNTKAV